jgi:exopolysaccharide biosynthesis polyprenyl glycosylphosphotransferase
LSSIADKPNAVELEELLYPTGVGHIGAAPLLHQFIRITTAAEVVGDFVAAGSGLMIAYAAYHLLGLGKNIGYPMQLVLGAAVTFAVLFVLMLDRDGAYREGHGLLRVRETERALRVSAQAFLLVLPITFIAAHLISRWVLALAFVFVPVIVVIQKQLFFLLMRALHAKGLGVRKVLIYGAGYTGRRVFSALIRSPKLGLEPVAIVDDDKQKAGEEIFAFGYRRERCAPVIAGPVTAELIQSYGADMVVVAVPALTREKFTGVAAMAESAGIRMAYVPSEAMPSDTWVDYADIDGLMLATLGAPAQRFLYEAEKRVLDCMVAVTVLVFAAPLLAAIACAVRMDSRGPAFFKQRRVGRNNRVFEMYKFRSMTLDARKYDFSPVESEDPRITKIGRLLRKTSLDELPQLFNVLKGDMSLVGPRPEMPFIVDQYGSRERQRLSVAAGITGLWQLSADRAFLIHENLQYDLYYIRNRGFFMDVAILLHTAMFAMRGV